MQIEYIKKTLSDVSNKIRGKSVGNVVEKLAEKNNNIQALNRDEQLILGGILGSQLHSAYCTSRRLDAPNQYGLMNEPRYKTLTSELDKEFVEKVLKGEIPTSNTLIVKNNQVIMDIANRDFVDLSPSWQYDNFMAGCTAGRLILSNWKALNASNQETKNFVIDAIASGIHESWLSRGNVYYTVDKGKVSTNNDLEVSYINLSQEEKEKDLSHIKMALSIISVLNTKIEAFQRAL